MERRGVPPAPRFSGEQQEGAGKGADGVVPGAQVQARKPWRGWAGSCASGACLVPVFTCSRMWMLAPDQTTETSRTADGGLEGHSVANACAELDLSRTPDLIF